MDSRRSSLEQDLNRHGLRLRGGFVPTPGDALPALPDGAPVAVVWLVGQVGTESWPYFAASAVAADGLPDPLDRWSESIGVALAARHGGIAIFPSDGPPWHPFQQWAQRAEAVRPSPLLLLIHPQHGLWHAYRFALALPRLHAEDAAALVFAPPPDLCAQCDGQPCLHACPVDAFDGQHYHVNDCAAHLHAPQGAECSERGCLARRACPVADGLRYGPAQAAFHMAAFKRARPG